ncbi:MAG: 50S ribosomal protein L4 [Clostridiales bacterium]|jgi:large subunit ribosomal protein L4|nr:50S ribosomal protein L4 [Clostridiales bacterium]
MPTAKVYNMAGEQLREIELSETIFGIEPNGSVLHESVKNYLANQRQGTQSTLTRAEVRGGGRKPWRQKGTGRARTGSTRAPNWTHGGVAFAPKPRDYGYTLNKKVKKLAMRSALSSKAKNGEIIVIDNIDMDSIKTRNFQSFLTALDVTQKALIVMPEPRENVIKSARNIPGVKTTIAGILSPYDIMNCKRFVVDEAALRKIEEVFA